MEPRGGGKGGAEERVACRFRELCGNEHCPWSHGDASLSGESARQRKREREEGVQTTDAQSPKRRTLERLSTEARQQFSQVRCPCSHPCYPPFFRPLPSLTLR